MKTPIIEIDVHGCNVETALKKIENEIRAADIGVYRIRVIHGFHGGTRIRDAILREFGYGLEPKIRQITGGSNQGITELVLRDY